MRPWLLVAAALTGCEIVPCPQNVTLTQADVPCSCSGAIVESVDCGELVCGEFGVELVKGTGTTGDCVTTSTYTDSSTTPVE